MGRRPDWVELLPVGFGREADEGDGEHKGDPVADIKGDADPGRDHEGAGDFNREPAVEEEYADLDRGGCRYIEIFLDQSSLPGFVSDVQDTVVGVREGTSR